jgi:hypothetical protein
VELIARAQEAGTLQTLEPEPGVVMFAWYYDKFGLHELGAAASDPQALMDYQPKLRMREQRADSARKEKMKKLASDYYFRYRMFRLEVGFENRGVAPRNYTGWDLPLDLKKWVYYEVVKCYAYVDRERLIKRLFDRLDEEHFATRSSVPKAQRTNRIRVQAPGGPVRQVNVTRALQAIGWEGLGFEEAVELEIERARGGEIPQFEPDLVELRRAIEGEAYLENEGLWEEAAPPALRQPYFDLVKACAAQGKRQVDDRGTVVLFAFPLTSGSDRERRRAFFEAIAHVRDRHSEQRRGRFFQFRPSATPPEDLYITHVINQWFDDPGARALLDEGKVHTVQWVDSRALAREVLSGFSRIGLQSSTGPRTAELRQRVLLVRPTGRTPFEIAYGARLCAQFGYDFNQAVDLSVIKAYLKVEGV